LNVLLKGNSFTYIKKDDIYIIADENIDTLTLPYLCTKGYSGFSSDSSIINAPFVLNEVPLFLKNQDMITNEKYQLRYSRSHEILKSLPTDLVKSHITNDIETNSLLIHGTIEDIERTKSAIAAIDTLRPQIAIEVLFVEYTENDSRDFGLEFGSRGQDGIQYPELSFSLKGKMAKDLFSEEGFSRINMLGEDFYAKLRLLISEGKANILARPTITVINGHEATVSIGETQYFKVMQGVGENITTRFSPINFGILLKISPVIAKNHTIAAEIEPEISGSNNTNNEGYPNVFSRKLKSSVQIEEGKTLILGGLVRQDEMRNDKKIPLLGDIPILGNLFRSRQKNFIKTNLCIYITPHIIDVSDSVSTEKIEKRFDESKYKRFLNDNKNF
jgi:type II secretory pathway component GspD/PulD (secretin)